MGLSHRTSPLEVLERASLDTEATVRLRTKLRASEYLAESLVVATCNRLEVYAETVAFHGAVDDIGAALSAASGVPRDELTPHLYVHYEDRAVAHTFSVACGLESMALGEGQILGQLRTALAVAQEVGTAGPGLNGLIQQALRVGKKAHTETAIDRAGPSLVEGGLALASEAIGDLAAARVLVMGAGAMSSLAATTLVRACIGDVVVVNRTRAKADHLAESLGVESGSWEDLEDELAAADLVLACTGATGHVVTADLAARLSERRGGKPQAFLDLALPRDVDPDAAEFATVIDLAGIGRHIGSADGEQPAVAAVRDLVTAEVADYLVLRRQKAVAPTVAALRRRASEVVSTELGRLDSKLPGMDDAIRREIRNTVNRVANQLLHAPTVRVKELATADGAGDYTAALRDLFDLDSRDIATVSVPPGSGCST